jgi:ADP-ribosylglycohydrolase
MFGILLIKGGSIMHNKVFGGLIGLCVGDALGVPVEFMKRTYLEKLNIFF